MAERPRPLVDEGSGWSTTDPNHQYSKWIGADDNELDAKRLQSPQTRLERIEALQLGSVAKLKEQDEKAREDAQPTAPPVVFGSGFVPVLVGDWIHNPNFVPLMPDDQFRKKTVEELLAMKDVNIGPQVFHLSASIRPYYRREFLKRMCERNRCSTTRPAVKDDDALVKDPTSLEELKDVMTDDVNYVVVSSTEFLNLELLAQQLEKSQKSKGEDAPADIRMKQDILKDLEHARRIGAQVILEEDLETLFLQRQRKLELIRGKTIQPGQYTFFVAGKTRLRSVENTGKYLAELGGVISPALDNTVDYVVVGQGLDAAFYDKVKKMGIKVLREDELPRFFGVEDAENPKFSNFKKEDQQLLQQGVGRGSMPSRSIEDVKVNLDPPAAK